MKYSITRNIVKLFSVILFIITLSPVSAKVMKEVQEVNIEGSVLQHTISPNGKFVFSSTLSPNRLYVHKRDADTGKLTQIQMIEKADLVPGKTTFFNPQGMVVSPDNKQLYIATTFGDASDNSFPFDDSVVRFDIGTDGSLTYRSRVVTDRAASFLTMDSNGRFLYVGDTGSQAQIAVLKRASNGNLSLANIVELDSNGNTLDDTQNITISPDNKTLYASSTSFDGHLYVFSINQTTGNLSPIQTLIHENKVTSHGNAGDIPVKGSGGTGVAVSKDGKFLYAVGGYGETSSETRHSVTVFKRKPDGTLQFFKDIQSPESSSTLGVLFSAEAHLILSPSEKYVYTFDPITKTIGVWKRNTSTGDLQFLDRIEEDNNIPNSKMYTSKDERHLYLNIDGNIKVFDLRSDLSIVKTDAVDPVSESGTIDYTLAITNEDGADAYNIIIKDTLPSGTSFISGSVNSETGSCSASGQIVTCAMGKVLNGDAYNAVIKVKAPASSGQITNTASVAADQLDTNTANNTDTETTNIGSGGGGSTPTNPTTGGGSGGGSIPLSILVLLSLVTIRRFSQQLKA